MIEPVSQINLTLHNTEKSPAFETARHEVIKYIKRRVGGILPKEAFEGKSFSADEVGTRRTEGIAIDNPPYWTLRFDDDDKEVAGRSWVIETALAEQGEDKPVLFGLRLQCITRGENPPYQRSIPTFAREIIKACDARLDNRRGTLTPWFVDSEDQLDQLIKLLCSQERTADVVVVSLAEGSSDPTEELISSETLAHDLAGAAHVIVISGQCSFHLTDRVGREFSVFRQAVRTYRPGFDPDTDDPFAHPLCLAQRIRSWEGGPDAYRRFVVSEALRRKVERVDILKVLPSFAEAKQTAAELRRREAKQAGKTNDELLDYAYEEIDRLKEDAKKNDEILEMAVVECDNAKAEVRRWQNTCHHLRQRVSSLESVNMKSAEVIPDNLEELEEWARKHLGGAVQLHNRALRSARDSEYEDIPFIYKALLLLRDYYVPMRREGGAELRQAFEQQCKKLDIEEQQTFSGTGAGEQGDTYFIRMDNRRFAMDRHLKKGNSREPRYCFRLYFFWDEVTSQVVVGWLPSHLKTRAS